MQRPSPGPPLHTERPRNQLPVKRFFVNRSFEIRGDSHLVRTRGLGRRDLTGARSLFRCVSPFLGMA
jgi:hypothetical protein